MLGKSLGSLFLSFKYKHFIYLQMRLLFTWVYEYIRISIEYKSNLLINEWVIILRSCIFFKVFFFERKSTLILIRKLRWLAWMECHTVLSGQSLRVSQPRKTIIKYQRCLLFDEIYYAYVKSIHLEVCKSEKKNTLFFPRFWFALTFDFSYQRENEIQQDSRVFI